MTTNVVFFQKFISGYGHYKLIATIDGQKYTTVTSNIPLINRIREESEDGILDATKEAVEMALDDNHFEYESVQIEYDKYNDSSYITVTY